jgi:rRNA maturation endonuclease Nob1
MNDEDKSYLLKKQEAVEPILEQDSMVCRICGHEVILQKTLGDGIWVDEKLDYCPHCGRAVKWDA